MTLTVVNEDRDSEIKSRNQRYERLWAFPQINAEYAFGIRRV